VRKTRIKKAKLRTVVERHQPYQSNSSKEMESLSLGSLEEKIANYKKADCYEHTWNYPSAPFDAPDQNPLLVNGPLSQPNLIDPAFVDLEDMTKPNSATCQLWLRKYDMSSSAVLGINGTDIGTPKEYYQTLNLRAIKGDGDGAPSEGVLAPFAFKLAVEGIVQFGLEKYDHVASKRYFEALRSSPRNFGGLGSLNEYSEAQQGQMRNPLRHVNPTLRQVITSQRVAKNLFFLDFQAMVVIVDIYDQELRSGKRTDLKDAKYDGLSGQYTLFNANMADTVGWKILNDLQRIKADLAAEKEILVDDVAHYLYYKRRLGGGGSSNTSHAEVLHAVDKELCRNLFDGESSLVDYLAYPVVLAVPIASDYISTHELNCFVDPKREVRSKKGGYDWLGTHKAGEALSYDDTYYLSAAKKVQEMQADPRICGIFPERARLPQNSKGFATNVVNAGARILSKVSIRRLVRAFSDETGAEFWKLETRLHRVFAENTLYPGYNGSYLPRLIKERYAGLEFLGSLAVGGNPSVFGNSGLQCIVPLLDLGTLRVPKFNLGVYGTGKQTECTSGVIARAGGGAGEDWGQPANSLVDLYSNRHAVHPSQVKAENYDMTLVVLNSSQGDEADKSIQREGIKNLEREMERIVDSILDSVVPVFKMGSREGPGLDIKEKLEEGDITIKVSCFKEDVVAADENPEGEDENEMNVDRSFLTIQAKLPFRSVRVEDTNGQVPERVPLFAAYQEHALRNGTPMKACRIQNFHLLFAQKPFKGYFEVGIPYCFVKYDVEKQELSIRPIYHALQVVAC